MRVIAICSEKGGVGKTTSAVHLAAAWGERGQRVLAIDFDPQFALTRRFGVTPSHGHTITDVLADALDLNAAIRPSVAPGVDLVAADDRLAAVEMNLRDAFKREHALARALEGELGEYDVVVIDCPPQLGLLTVNALCAADEAIVPVDMQAVDALMGATKLVANLQQLADGGERVRLTALFRVRDDRRRVVQAAIDEALDGFDLPVAKTRIPDRAEFHHAALAQQTVGQLAPSGSGARAYRDLSIELDAVIAHV